MNYKNLNLFNEFRKLNIILQSGWLNTRYKIMVQKHFPELHLKFSSSYSYKASLYHEIINFDIPNCKQCQTSLKNFFTSGNFIFQNYPYQIVCSTSCNYELTKINQKLIRSSADKEKHRIIKFKETMSKQENGSSKAHLVAIKAAKTKSETFINGKSLLELQTEKTRKTQEHNGNWTPLEKISDFHKYRRIVKKITNTQPIHLLENYHLRGHYNNNGYHLDHIFSIYHGFLYKISPNIIGDIINLRFIPAIENTTKSKRSDITIFELFQKFHDYHFLKIK